MMIEFGHSSHVGLRREHNEDTYQADPELGLWLVADGMGGHARGEVASALARDSIAESVAAGMPLAEALREADRTIMEQSAPSHSMLPMGTTVAALHLRDDHYEVAWVGDSRVYLAQDRLQQLSQDHSVVVKLVEEGKLTEDEARHHPRRNEITQALGITPPDMLHVSCVDGPLQAGSQFLLCSDGLTEEVADARIEAIIMQPGLTAQECVDHLLVAALEAGGSDNITAILVRVGTLNR